MPDNKEKTGFGKFISKVTGTIKDSIPDILEIGAKVATGNIGGAIDHVRNRLMESKDPASQTLLQELELNRMNWQKEMEELHAKDRADARKREVDLASATGGKKDLLMLCTGFTILGLLITCVIAVLFYDIKNSQLSHILIGEIFGLGLSIAAYYFGTSKSSNDKTKMLGGNK